MYVSIFVLICVVGFVGFILIKERQEAVMRESMRKEQDAVMRASPLPSLKVSPPPIPGIREVRQRPMRVEGRDAQRARLELQREENDAVIASLDVVEDLITDMDYGYNSNDDVVETRSSLPVPAPEVAVPEKVDSYNWRDTASASDSSYNSGNDYSSGGGSSYSSGGSSYDSGGSSSGGGGGSDD